MTTTITTASVVAPRTRGLWRTGAVAGLAAATATTAVAAAAHAAGVSLEGRDGEMIPLAGFPQVTLVCVALGLAVATVVRRRAARPPVTFTRVAAVLTVVSCGPSLLVADGPATAAVLVLTHLVAAAIVVPPLARELAAR